MSGLVFTGEDEDELPIVGSGESFFSGQQPVEESQAPYFACKYCGLSDEASVVRCIESGFWFCNSSGDTSASHIIHHLVRAKNKEICLHPESPLGETIVECYNCSNRNIFTMGFIPAKGESVVILLCRNCLGIGALKELGWNMDNWTPLVEDRQLVSWLVKVPDEREQRQVDTAMINRLEEMWKKNPVAKVGDLGGPDVDDSVEPVQLRYEDGYQYQNVFGPLVELEADYDQEMKTQMREENVSLRWKVSEVSGRVTAVLVFSAAMSESLRVAKGDELLLELSKHFIGDMAVSKDMMASKNDKKKKKGGWLDEKKRGRDWKSTGTVVKIEDDGEVCVELYNKDGVPLHVDSGFSVSFVWKPVSFDRMQKAMRTLATEDKSLSGYLYHKILGHDVEDQVLKVDLPTKYGVNGLPDLNESQIEAIRQVLRKPLALIQGPPGTGKTVTSASLVYHMLKQNKGERVLVTAPSNVAVDQLAEKIHQAGLKVIRLAAKSREHLETSVEHLTLHHVILHLESPAALEFRSLLQKKEDMGSHLSSNHMRRLDKLRRGLEQQVLKAADVICCTCSGAGDTRLSTFQFHRVLLDEATQATEPESLIPLVHGCKQFVLVGDHCQLGPVVMCKKAANAGLNSSLFERLVTLGLRPIRLQVQYRMHPCLSEFPSNTFYEGSLQNGVSAAERCLPELDFPWPNPSKPMMFYSCTGTEELASTGTSYLNRTEASNCERVVTALLRGGAVPSQIGVVTPYEGQRAYIVTHMQRHGPLRLHLYKEIEVSSVDAFQGREKDFIILSCVRSNEKQGIGFLNDPRRLNVALTRAKYGVIILGNPRVLSKQPLWNTLLLHFRELELLVEGSLSNLQVSLMRFSTGKKFYRDRRQRMFEEHSSRVFSGDVNDPFGENAKNGKAPVDDSRYDPIYANEFQQGPLLPMPDISGLDMSDNSLPVYRPHGYGDFDYVANSLQRDSTASQAMYPFTQAAAASQSQFTQPQSQSQYHFQDEDED